MARACGGWRLQHALDACDKLIYDYQSLEDGKRAVLDDLPGAYAYPTSHLSLRLRGAIASASTEDGEKKGARMRQVG